MVMFKIQPIEMIKESNYYSNIDQFVIPATGTCKLWFQLRIVDSLGERPYISASNDLLKLEFLRITKLSLDSGKLYGDSQTIEKTANPNTSNRSIFSVDLTSDNVVTIRSGSVRFYYKETTPNIEYKWVENYIARKDVIDPGF
jgi:hypothetical protein